MEGAAAEWQSLMSRPGVQACWQGAIATRGWVVGVLVRLPRRHYGRNHCHTWHELRCACFLSGKRQTEHSTANWCSSPRGENSPHKKPWKIRFDTTGLSLGGTSLPEVVSLLTQPQLTPQQLPAGTARPGPAHLTPRGRSPTQPGARRYGAGRARGHLMPPPPPFCLGVEMWKGKPSCSPQQEAQRSRPLSSGTQSAARDSRPHRGPPPLLALPLAAAGGRAEPVRTPPRRPSSGSRSRRPASPRCRGSRSPTASRRHSTASPARPWPKPSARPRPTRWWAPRRSTWTVSTALPRPGARGGRGSEGHSPGCRADSWAGLGWAAGAASTWKERALYRPRRWANRERCARWGYCAWGEWGLGAVASLPWAGALGLGFLLWSLFRSLRLWWDAAVRSGMSQCSLSVAKRLEVRWGVARRWIQRISPKWDYSAAAVTRKLNVKTTCVPQSAGSCLWYLQNHQSCCFVSILVSLWLLKPALNVSDFVACSCTVCVKCSELCTYSVCLRQGGDVELDTGHLQATGAGCS